MEIKIDADTVKNIVEAAKFSNATLNKAIRFDIASDGNISIVATSESGTAYTVCKKLDYNGPDFSFAVASVMLKNVMEVLPECTIEFAEDKPKITFREEDSKIEVLTLNKSELKMISSKPLFTAQDEVAINAEILKAGLSAVFYACSDKDDTPATNSVLIYTEGKRIVFQARDGYRFAQQTYNIEQEANLPKTYLPSRMAKQIVNDKTIHDIVYIARNDKKFRIRSGNIEMYFPRCNIDSMDLTDLPQADMTLIIDTEELSTSLKKADIASYSELTPPLVLAYEPKENTATLSISVASTVANVDDAVSCAAEHPHAIRLGLNLHYAMQTLKQIETKTLQINFKTPFAPVFFVPKFDEPEKCSACHVILPVRLRSE